MKLLAFDTSTQVMGIALLINDKIHCIEQEGGARASDTLLAQISELLLRFNLSILELDAVAFGCGPGAFTGLRTACAAAQGIAMGANLPVIPIVTLHAGAQQFMLEAPQAFQDANTSDVLVLLDARMDEWYWAHYQWKNNQWHTLAPPSLSSPEALQTYIAQSQPTKTITINNAQMQGMIALGQQAFNKGQTVLAQDVLPLYLRNKVALTTIERMTLREQKAAQIPAKD